MEPTVENEIRVVTKNDMYKKYNGLIGAKYKSSLIENKLLAISLSKSKSLVKEKVKIKDEYVDVYTSVMTSDELMKHLGVTRKNLPAQVKQAYLKMSSRQIGVEDSDGQFRYRSLFIGGDYSNGQFKLYYNPLLAEYYKNVDINFTTLSLETMMSFKSVHSFRLYELIKKDCFIKEGKVKPGTVFKIKYELSELKLSLGVVNAAADNVRTILQQKGPLDYDKAVEISSEKGFERWADFKRRCIDPAIKEINEKTNMNIIYEKGASGQGGKIRSITFIVTIKEQNNVKQPVVEQKTDEEKDEFAFELSELFGSFGIKKFKDLKQIAEASQYNYDKCLKASKVLKSQSQQIDNVMGFVLQAIKENWEPPTKKEISWNVMMTHDDYDFEELERAIVENN